MEVAATGMDVFSMALWTNQTLPGGKSSTEQASLVSMGDGMWKEENDYKRHKVIVSSALCRDLAPYSFLHKIFFKLAKENTLE